MLLVVAINLSICIKRQSESSFAHRFVMETIPIWSGKNLIKFFKRAWFRCKTITLPLPQIYNLNKANWWCKWKLTSLQTCQNRFEFNFKFVREGGSNESAFFSLSTQIKRFHGYSGVYSKLGLSNWRYWMMNLTSYFSTAA